MNKFFLKIAIKSTTYSKSPLKGSLLLCLSFSFFTLSSSVSAKHPYPFQKPNKMAILGDEVSQGERANPSTPSSAKKIFAILKGKKPEPSSNIESPETLWPSFKSFHNSLNWVFKNLLASLAKISINEPRDSWGALTAKKLGMASSGVTIAAQKGASLMTFAEQYEQVLKQHPKEYLDTYFIAFAGGDLCQADPAFIPSSQSFAKRLGKLIDYMIIRDLEIKEKNRPLQIVILNYIGMTQVLSSEAIGNKEIGMSKEGEAKTCKTWINSKLSFNEEDEEGKQDFEGRFLQMFFPINPKLSCSTLYSPISFAERETSFWSRFNRKTRDNEIKQAIESQVINLASRVRNYRDKIKEVILLKQKKYAKNSNVRLFFVEQTENISFKPQDIANCSMINLNGQQKISQQVLLSLKP